jgi:serine/threonine protein kinase
VYKGFLGKKRVEVAVKQVQGDESAQVEVMKELEMLCKMASPRIVALYGAMELPAGGGLGLVMEFCSKGSLDSLLQKDVDGISVPGLVSISMQVAEGLEYLAGLNVLHRDLACRNCLVDGEDNVKLSE